MKTILINNQKIRIETKHLVISLREPFWGAYQKYGWTDKVEGFGLSSDLINKAIKLKKKIKVKYKYGEYEITPEKAISLKDKYTSIFLARNGTILYVIPRDGFKKIVKEEIETNLPILINPKIKFKILSTIKNKLKI